jgi:hypothetical protein
VVVLLLLQAYVLEFGKCFWTPVFAEVAMMDVLDGEEEMPYPEIGGWLRAA